MNKNFLMLIIVIGTLIIGVGAYATYLDQKPQQIVCTMEAQLCSDGSSVGRSGPKCEFTPCPEVNVPEETKVKLEQKIIINEVTIRPLVVVEDSRCPSDVQCIQAGTVRLKVILEQGANVQEATLTLNTPTDFLQKQITLQVVTPLKFTATDITPEDYQFEFVITDVSRATTGLLQGQMTIGPICPVQTLDNPCEPTAEMYAAHKISIYTSDQKTLVTILTPDASGKFSASLPIGSYYVTSPPSSNSIGGVWGLPAIVIIKSNATYQLAVDIDTGIR